MEKLAIEGGTPVRKEPFPSNWLGVTMYGEEELAELTEVIADKSPFRDYGLNNPCKTKDFEKKAREYIGTKFAVAVTSGN